VPTRREFLILACAPLIRPAWGGRVSQPAQAARVSFPSYKGMNYAWGRDARGVSTFHAWLNEAYDPIVFAADLDLMAAMGVRTVGLWVWLDRMIVKDAGWGTPAYVPRFDPQGVANWEDALGKMRARGMAAVVNLLQRSDPSGYVPAEFSFESRALFPVLQEQTLLGPGAGNGDMSRGIGTLPVGWKADGQGEADWLPAGGGPTPGNRCLRLNAQGPGGAMRLYSPRAPADGGRLLAIRVPVKGVIQEVMVEYFGASGALLDYDLWWVGHDFGDAWTTLALCNRLDSLPPHVTQTGLQVVTTGVGCVGSVQIVYARRDARWHNYMQVVGAWVRRYGTGTRLGGAVAGWQAVKEGYAGMRWADWGGWIPLGVMHDFYRDFYAAVRGAGTRQPVGMDSIATVRSILETDKAGALVNLPWYRDVADYYNVHLYNDAGAVPAPAARLDKPWIIGEAGASESGLHYGDPRYETLALAAFLANGRRLGARAVLPWSVTDSKALVRFEDGKPVLGPSGQMLAAMKENTEENGRPPLH